MSDNPTRAREEITPEELERIERSGHDSQTVRDLIAALREAWAERDRLMGELYRAKEKLGDAHERANAAEKACYGAWDDIRMAEREACAKLVDGRVAELEAIRNQLPDDAGCGHACLERGAIELQIVGEAIRARSGKP